MYKLLIFDWDGTLADSTSHIVECLEAASNKMQAPFPGREAAKNIIGLGLSEAIIELFGIEDELFVDSFKEAYSAQFLLAEITRSGLYPGVIDMLVGLREAGYLTAIATGKSRRGMDRALKAMEMCAYFDAVRCADETRSKPDPLMLQELLEKFSLQPHEAVMVGDTEYDMEMAMRLGMDRVAMSHGAHQVSRLQKYQPVAVANNVAELQELFL
ncbi:HAD family hydrolase [Hahella sp. KA22]|uniref:HAD family hydrolase n=1 Tax=Hahella sp. KA22 TaxID=1628392 RepID=UPI000FDEC03C|nr:HAD-IA family hydrolase [Hahella sp. KA22]AZZ91536.1 HAD family hydrolase [Hahella sp. KA22]QAY54905.1 HAD family hydrolase [Hahella sp. KA22]